VRPVPCRHAVDCRFASGFALKRIASGFASLLAGHPITCATMSHTFVPHVAFGLNPMLVSLAILAITYAVVIGGRINRAVAVSVGAIIVILVGALDQAQAVRGIDWDTIGLLTGMMILVAISRRCGLFQYLAIRSAQAVKASPAGILLMLQLATALLSALLNNLSTVLLIVPVTLVIAEELELKPYPFLFAEVFASNIGGTATLIGDPPNILIGTETGLDFNAFLANVAPAAALVMAVQLAIVHLLWGRRMHASRESRVLIMGMNASGMITDWALLRWSVAVMALMLIAFIAAPLLHLQLATIALSGAALLMLFDNWRYRGAKQQDNVHNTLAEVEWTTIFFFIGLFVLVQAVEVSGLLALVAKKFVGFTGDNMMAAATLVLWASAALSALFDNIPFVATMIPVIKNMAAPYGGPAAIVPLWWALSLGACLGGNGTLAGAAANIAVAGLAERNGIRFGFMRYLAYAAPMALVSIAICQLYIWLRYL
jgi:Na+/H+ antiporter NhaD/arsenite permease-like protein